MSLLVLALLLLPGPAPVQGSPLHVDASAQGAGTGSDWTNAFTDLQSALSAATAGQEIWVAAGTYRPDVTPGGASGNRGATFQLKSGVALFGAFPPGGGDGSFGARDLANLRSRLSGDIGLPGVVGDNSYHVVTGDGTDATAILDGFEIVGGNASGTGTQRQGGGMSIRGGSPLVRNCWFMDNRAQLDGGGLAVFGSPVVVDCAFLGNVALARGGGIYNDGGSQLVLNCAFWGNVAGTTGGGLHNLTSSSMIVGCIVWRNTGTPIGGAPQVTYCCVEGGYPGVGNLSLDPLFLDAAAGDLRLGDGSPCIDGGLLLPALPAEDLAGAPRIVRVVDMGPLERPAARGARTPRAAPRPTAPVVEWP